MLSTIRPESRKIENAVRKGNALYLTSEDGILRIIPKTAGIIRITYARLCNENRLSGNDHEAVFVKEQSPGITNSATFADWTYKEDEADILLRTPELLLRISRKNGAIAYSDNSGRLFLSEDGRRPRELDRFTVCRISDDGSAKIAKIRTADGEKSIITEGRRIEDGFLYHSRLYFDFSADEAIYGLGQHEEGYADLRGKTVYVHQANRKIAVPFFVSTKGYGILTDTYSPLIFNDCGMASYIFSEAVKEMDYYFIAGTSTGGGRNGGLPDGAPDLDKVIAGYRLLTGAAAMLPKWAFGYIQSQERYETQQEIEAVAAEFRKRHIGVDCVVLDWLSWSDNMWGQKRFDEKRFPDPSEMIDRLHEKNVHFMISIWPNMSENTLDHAEFREKSGTGKGFLTGTEIYNAFNEDARKLYWKQVNEHLYKHGTDSWWCDSSEPVTPEWNDFGRIEPARLYEKYVSEVSNNIPAELTNAFCLFHARTLYEGMRGMYDAGGEAARDGEMPEACKKDNNGKRVCNLTRSGYTGSQRYGTILWSGDVSASWDTLTRQIAAGINFSASGLPYWTTDIGAFFVKKSAQWFWDGEFEEGLADPGYKELYVRWYEWECFLPVFRAHGTDVRREPWNFADDDRNIREIGAMEDAGLPKNAFYNALIKYNRMRYRLLPYIYSLAGFAWLEGGSVIRPLAFEFPQDRRVRDIKDQYMMGHELMICPVHEMMYFCPGGGKLENTGKTRTVYLPEGEGFYDFYTGEFYEGGQTIEVQAPLDTIPVFVKEGSIIPVGNDAESAAQAGRTVSFRVFSKRGTSTRFYEDRGDGYGYENGEYEITKVIYDAEDKSIKRECKKQL